MQLTNAVIYPGTFDPITKGHMDILRRASKIFATVIIAVAKDTVKNTLFSLEERVEIVEAEIKNHNLQNVKVLPFEGLLIDFAKQLDVYTIVRGLRAVSDFEYEFQLAYMNHKMHRKIETIFFPATEDSHYISSRFVKEVARLGGNIDDFVSVYVQRRLKECLKN